MRIIQRLWLPIALLIFTTNNFAQTPVNVTKWNGVAPGAGNGVYVRPASSINWNVIGSVAHDASGTSTDPILVGCYASAAAPSDVSGDGDATRLWCLRNGSIATTITAAGALIGGDAANGLDVDITRMAALVAGSAIIGNIRIDQTTPGTTNKVSIGTDGTVTALGAVDRTSYAYSTDKANTIGAVYQDTSPNVTAGQSAGLRMTIGRALLVNPRNTAGTETTAVDNVGFTDGTTPVTPTGFIYDEVAGTALTENDAGAGRMDVKRAVVGVLEDATTRGQRAAVSAGGALKVDNSAVTQPVSIATLPALAAGAALIGSVGIDQTTPGTTNLVQVTDGAGALNAIIDSMPSVTIGTFPDNEPFNVAQINGVTPLMGNGASGTGAQRVTLANDSTGIVSLTTSTASIGKLAANSGIDIGDVDVTSVVPGTGLTNLGKAEDLASADLDVGVMALGIRKAAPANTSGTDGDYEPFQISAGRLWTSSTIDAALPAGAALIGKVGIDQTTPGTTNRVDVGVFPDNEPFNVAQINGVTPLMGNGATGTGALRVSIANDSTGIVALTTSSATIGVLAAGNNNVGDVDVASAVITGGAVAHDGGASAVNPILTGCYSSAAAPTDVNADTDSAREWCLRNGARAVQPTFAGVLQSTGNGTAGTGTPRVTIASDNTTFPVTAAATLANETTKVIGTVRMQGNVGAAVDAAVGAAPPANAVMAGGVGSGATGGFVINHPVCDQFVPINISTATTTLIVTGVSGRHVYICGMSLVTAAANNVALLTGTGATCGTSTAGMTGGTTAASGYNFAANGGISQGSGVGAINRTETTGDSVCIITSATTQLSGTFSYAIY